MPRDLRPPMYCLTLIMIMIMIIDHFYSATLFTNAQRRSRLQRGYFGCMSSTQPKRHHVVDYKFRISPLFSLFYSFSTFLPPPISQNYYSPYFCKFPLRSS